LEYNGAYLLLVYVDVSESDESLLAKNKCYKNDTEPLLVKSKEAGIEVKAEKLNIGLYS
jgi:hypothetical protein